MVVVGKIPQVLKQLILFVISIKAGNKYCTALHGHAVLDLDKTLTYDDLKRLANGQALESLPDSYMVALDVVTKAALENKSVASENFDFENQLRDEGFSERQIDELMAQAHFGIMMNLVTDIFEIPLDRPFPLQ